MVALTALLVLVGTFVALGALGAFIAFALRRNQREQRRMTLASQCFTGQPQAVVHLAAWGLPVADIRQVAGQRGYAEAQTPDPSVLVFHQAQCAPGGMPGTPGAGAPGAAPLRAPQRLSERLASAEFVWVDIAVSGGTPADVAALASQHGAHILRTYGDRTRPVVLVGKRPIHSVREVASGRHGLRSWATLWLARGLARSCGGWDR